MSPLQWGQVGQKTYETGLDRGVLFKIASDGTYGDGVAWNGLTTVTESPSGAESTKQYADNGVYANLQSAEEYGATIEAFTYPAEFAEHDGLAVPVAGVSVGQQTRKPFGFAYRTLKGNDIEGTDLGYKLHLVYGCQASPSEKTNSTVNDSPELTAFSWEVTTTPVQVTGLKPTASITIDSTEVDPGDLQALEDLLYGAAGDATMPLPDAVIALLEGTAVEVKTTTLANQPSYNSGTHVITIPSVTGLTWSINGVEVATGAQPALTSGQTALVTVTADSGYYITGDDDWIFEY